MLPIKVLNLYSISKTATGRWLTTIRCLHPLISSGILYTLQSTDFYLPWLALSQHCHYLTDHTKQLELCPSVIEDHESLCSGTSYHVLFRFRQINKKFEASVAVWMRLLFFWHVTQRWLVVFTDVSGQPINSLFKR